MHAPHTPAAAEAAPTQSPTAVGTAAVLRDRLFRETWNRWAQRWLLGTAYALRPARLADFPSLVFHVLADASRGGTRIPEQERTWQHPDTFGGTCRDTSPDTVLAAARLGFFPWCHCGPLKWWTRRQRMVLRFDDHHIGKRLRRDMKKWSYRVTFDQAFEHVIAACAGHRSYNRHSLTWITPEIMRLYTDLFDRGHAHSFEVWDETGTLVGGGYGVAVGRVFVTESQFSLRRDTSKVGFAVLNYHLAKWGYILNDAKDFSPALEAMGFGLIPRSEYEEVLSANAMRAPSGGPWAVTAAIAEVADWYPRRTASPDANQPAQTKAKRSGVRRAA